MKNKLVIPIVIFTILLGIVALALNTALGNHTITYIEKIRYTTGNTSFYYWKFTWWQYLSNLELTTTDLSILQFDMPSRQWIHITATITQEQFWIELGNNMALMLDYVIMVINILLYPLKIGAYLLRNVLAILGINQDTTDSRNGLAWMVIFVRDILTRIVIPYI